MEGIAMKNIHHNPFRILDIPVTASVREINNKVGELEMFIELEKTLNYQSDYTFLAPIERTLDMVRSAKNMIETDESRFFYSLFWFWKFNSTDELAMEVLKDGNVETAIRLLEKQVASGQDFSKSHSSARNLSVIYMALSSNNGSFSIDNFSNGLQNAGKILKKDLLSEYASLLTAKNFKFSYDKIVQKYVDEILNSTSHVLKEFKENSLHSLIFSFEHFDDRTKEYVADRFTSKYFKKIEDEIAHVHEETVNSPEKANIFAAKLINDTKSDIEILRNAIGFDNFKYKNLSEKLASTLIDCSVAFWNYYINKDVDFDIGDICLKINNHARKFSTNLSTASRIENFLEILQSWNEGKEERENQNKIKKSMDFIYDRLNSLPGIESIAINDSHVLLKEATQLLRICQPHFQLLRNLLGKNDEYLIKLSSDVANISMNFAITYANRTKKSTEVHEIFKIIYRYQMDAGTRERFNQNNNIFINNIVIDKNISPIRKAIESIPNVDTIKIENYHTLLHISEKLAVDFKTNLMNIKSVDNDLYLNLSSSLAGSALSICITYANKTGNMDKTLDVMKKIELLDMDSELRSRFNENKNILEKNLAGQVMDYLYQSNKKNPEKKVDKGFCYIATMVYKDYDAHEVIVLRSFRDNTLNKYSIGRLFVVFYYALSPYFVKYFCHSRIVNRFAKLILDFLVRSVK
jgi:hypothetical protein